MTRGAGAPDGPPALPVVSVGAGGMGLAWLRVLEASPEAELVGIVDLDLAAARRAAEAIGRADLPVGLDAVTLAEKTGARAVVNVTVPAAHHPVTTTALFAGLPVLGEKPVADTLARALSLVAAAEVTGKLFMVSQSRRWNPQVAALRGMVEDLGAVGAVTTEFFKAPHFGGFREEMEHPLLIDMAIHAFDTVRYLLGVDPISASCHTWNPPWSWYAGDANASVLFEMDGGARYVFTGSWCAPGAETSWNGRWRVSSELGSVLWDGDGEPTSDAQRPLTQRARSHYDGIAGSFQIFCEALRTGETPMGEVHENVMSLAMVEAATESALTGTRVVIDHVLDRAYGSALHEEQRPDVREALASWSSVREALVAPGSSIAVRDSRVVSPQSAASTA